LAIVGNGAVQPAGQVSAKIMPSSECCGLRKHFSAAVGKDNLANHVVALKRQQKFHNLGQRIGFGEVVHSDG